MYLPKLSSFFVDQSWLPEGILIIYWCECETEVCKLLSIVTTAVIVITECMFPTGLTTLKTSEINVGKDPKIVYFIKFNHNNNGAEKILDNGIIYCIRHISHKFSFSCNVCLARL